MKLSPAQTQAFWNLVESHKAAIAQAFAPLFLDLDLDHEHIENALNDGRGNRLLALLQRKDYGQFADEIDNFINA